MEIISYITLIWLFCGIVGTLIVGYQNRKRNIYKIPDIELIFLSILFGPFTMLMVII